MGRFATGLIAALAAGLSAGTALAGSMEARFGNTVLISGDQGETKLFYNEDNSFTATVSPKDGAMIESKGTWRIEGDQVCITPERAFLIFEAGKERCVPLQGEKVGDSWQTTSKGPDGQDVTATISIVAGR